VPAIIPVPVIVSAIVAASSGATAAAAAFASPKSSTLTVPSGVILMLPGFRSRCTIPLSWAAASPSAI
jgi:hypothetical protein